MTRCIYLNGDDRFMTLVDDEDYDWAQQFRWHLHDSKTVWYASRMIYLPGDTRAKRKRRRETLHIEIMKRAEPMPVLKDLADQPIRFVVDHKDGNTLNTRRSNLRWATYQENYHNLSVTTRRYWGRRSGVKPTGQDPETARLIFPYEETGDGVREGNTGCGVCAEVDDCQGEPPPVFG